MSFGTSSSVRWAAPIYRRRARTLNGATGSRFKVDYVATFQPHYIFRNLCTIREEIGDIEGLVFDICGVRADISEVDGVNG